MRLSSLCVSTLLVASVLAWGQHSSTSSGGSSSGSSGGGSHSGGSSFSSSSHSSGGPGGYSHADGSHASVMNGSARSSTSHSSASPANFAHQRGPVAIRSTTEKRTLGSFLRHPFRKPTTRTIVEIRSPICKHGSCRVCPIGQVRSGAGCGSVPVPVYARHDCSFSVLAGTNPCQPNLYFDGGVDDACLAQRAALNQQETLFRTVQADEESACRQADSAECAAATANLQTEQARMGILRDRYRACRLNHGLPANTISRNEVRPSFDPLRFQLND